MRSLLPAALLGLTLAAAPEPYDTHVLPSRELGDARRVWVRVPPNYALHRRALPLTIVLDGDSRPLLDLAAAAARYTPTLDFLDPEMPPQIVVGVESRDRGREFGSGAAATERFVVRELLPFLARTYRVAGPHVVVGHSLAGAFALRLMCDEPATFAGVVAASPALDSADFARVRACLTSPPAGPARAVYVAVGERANDRTEEQFRPWILRLRALADSLGPSARARVVVQPGVSHTRTPLAAVPEGLAFLLAGGPREPSDSLKLAFLRGGVDPLDMLRRVAADRERLGIPASVPLPARWGRVAALLLGGAKRLPAADSVLRATVDAYPEDHEALAALADVRAQLGDSAGARALARRAVTAAERREDLSPRARETEIAALRTRWRLGTVR